MTPEELRLWLNFCRGYRPRILRQRPISFYIVDFYCPKAKLVIEVDGSWHYHPEQQVLDVNRTAQLEEFGLDVLRFDNVEVRQNFAAVCDRIDAAIQVRLG